MYVCMYVLSSHEYSLDHDQYCSLSDVDMYTNHDMVEKAFEECDLTHEGRYIHTYILHTRIQFRYIFLGSG